ncbi:MAG: methyl-accepting chemotaxis protein [Pseudomonadota bacterium]
MLDLKKEKREIMTHIGFDKKLLIGSLGVILLTILIIAAVNFIQSRKAYLSKGKTGIENVSNVLLKSLELKYNLQKQKLDSEIGLLMAEVEKERNVMVIEDRFVDMDLFEKTSGQKTSAQVPQLMFGLKFVTGASETVDNVAKFTDSTVMVYQFYDHKLINVSSSHKGADGKPDTGEYYSVESDLYKTVFSGSDQQMLTRTGDGLLMQFFRPFKENMDDKIAGAFSIASKVLTSDLEILVKSVNVSGKGYSFICDPKGAILTHPDQAFLKLNVRDFENGAKILETQKGLVIYRHNEQTYYAYTHYFKPWDLSFVTAVSQSDLMAGINQQIILSSIVSGAMALVIGFLIISIMNRQLMASMNGMAQMAREVAKGNFNYSFSYRANDAIRDTVEAMTDMVGGLALMIRNLNEGVQTLSVSSGELNTISVQMSQGARTSVTRVNTVAAAAEEMSVNMNSVAAAMEQASTNVNVVATGASDMKTSLEQVVENSNKAMAVTRTAVDRAQKSSSRMDQLSLSARQINKVTETINDISSQTNLLALNATIEAARAGEAGRGFAVVAGEIKTLANQTAQATKEIETNINAIQDQTRSAVTEIREIVDIIGQIDEFVNDVSTAIDVQSATTREISDNISQISIGIQEVNENVSQSSLVSENVALEISDVLLASQQVDQFSSEVKKKAEILNDIMHQFEALTERFKV